MITRYSIPLLLAGCWSLPVLALDNPNQLQLAQTLDTQDLESLDFAAYWYAEKYDGVRGFWDGKQLTTRQGNPIAAPDWFTADLPPFAVEGELWAGRGQFERVSGVARTQEPKDSDWQGITFQLFDLPRHPGDFLGRRQVLETWHKQLPAGSHLQITPIAKADSEEQLLATLKAWQAAGAEGIMLYREGSYYQARRTWDLVKLKGYQDAEARVVAHVPGQGKYTGMLGALLVETPQGIRFKIGSGFSDSERASPPAVGSLITYRFNGYTRTGKPRFARFERLRESENP